MGARLSEDPSASVLVLEAGGEEDYYWFSHIPGFAPHLQIGDFDWEYKTEPQKFCCNAFVNRVGQCGSKYLKRCKALSFRKVDGLGARASEVAAATTT